MWGRKGERSGVSASNCLKPSCSFWLGTFFFSSPPPPFFAFPCSPGVVALRREDGSLGSGSSGGISRLPLLLLTNPSLSSSFSSSCCSYRLSRIKSGRWSQVGEELGYRCRNPPPFWSMVDGFPPSPPPSAQYDPRARYEWEIFDSPRGWRFLFLFFSGNSGFFSFSFFKARHPISLRRGACSSQRR